MVKETMRSSSRKDVEDHEARWGDRGGKGGDDGNSSSKTRQIGIVGWDGCGFFYSITLLSLISEQFANLG